MKEHFSGRLAIILVLVTIVVMSVFVVTRYIYSSLHFENEISTNGKVISARIAEQVSPSIWEIYQSSVNRKFSEDAAVAILNSEMKARYVDAIVVYGRFGHTYMGRTKDADGNVVALNESYQQALDEHKYRVDHPIKNGSMTIGKVSVYFNNEPLREQQVSALKFDLIQTMFISIFIVSALYISIRKVLIKPLESLEIANRTINSIEEGIVYLDSDHRVIGVNPAFCFMTGFDENDVNNKPCDYFVIEDSGSRLVDEVDSAIERQTKWSGEALCRRKDGTAFPVYLTASQVFNEVQQQLCRVFVFQDISKQKESEEQLKSLAFYDPLTKLYNRRKFEDLIHAEVKAAKRAGSMMGLLFIDLDDFKHINDSLGHSSGDRLLIEVAKRFRSRVRDTDHLSRLGGDEFTVIAPHLKCAEDMVHLAEDLLELASKPITFQGKEFKFGASIGVSLFPNDGEEVEQLIKYADAAMYQAKETGKCRYTFYSSELDEKNQHKQRIKSLLRSAIDNDEFFLEYQPKISLSGDQETIGAEALIRWKNNEFGMIPPDEFIPVAEESDIIIQIGNWVIEQAFAVTYDLNVRRRVKPLKMAINLSPVQLHSEALLPFIRQQVEKHSIKTDWIEFEITESSIISDLDHSIQALQKLRDMGFSIALDDFGTGYSSLNYLTKLPIETLKIDKSFVMELESSEQAKSVVETIVALSNSLGLESVAEGIESEEHHLFLQSLGCEYGQGYHFSRPLTYFDFLEFIAPKAEGNVVKMKRVDH
jgi:diguanylate cyclase (GGDEF)-like protein/PAS domain S-box-containing protein